MTGHIPQSFIDELLTRIDIVSVIETYITLKKAGTNYLALCPFHQEKTPSFTVSPNKQFFHCFGCGISGNAISFLMEYERMNFVDAIETLATQAGIEIPREAGISIQQPETQQFYEIMQKTALFYQRQLGKHSQSKRALDYLNQRGLSEKIIKQFKIGYTPPGWDNLLQAIDNNPKQKQHLVTTGMLIQKNQESIYDRFRDRIMFPIHDRRGRVIAFGGRVLSDEDTPKYLNSPETPIFHKGSELYGLYEARQANRQINRLLLVEGYMDVVALAQHGIDYAVATLGTSITANHLQLLLRTSQEIIFCFDGDNAGLAAAWRAMEITIPLLRDDWQIKFMFVPKGEDPDSLIRKEDKSKFEERIQQASSLPEFFFQHLSAEVDLQQIDGRARLVSLAMPYIQKMSADIMREMFLESLSKRVNMDINKLNKYIPTKSNSSPKNDAGFSSNQEIKPLSSPMRTAIALLIQHPNLAQYADKFLNSDINFKLVPGMNLLHEILKLARNNANLTTGAILEHWRDKQEFTHLVKLAGYKHLLSEHDLTTEFHDILKKLHLQALEFTIEQLISKATSGKLSDIEKKQLQDLLKRKQNF
jgi:DNA primase